MRSLRYSSCGEWLATGGHRTVSLWKSTSSSSSLSSSSGSSTSLLGSGESCGVKWVQAITVKGFAGAVKGVAWKPRTLEFVTGCEDGSVRVWRIVNAAGTRELKDTAADDGADDVVEHEGEGAFSAQSVWGAGYPVLMADKAVLVDAVGLGDANRFLLKQRGALDGTPPLEEELESEDDLEEE